MTRHHPLVMNDSDWHRHHATASLKRLLPRLEARFAGQVDVDEWQGYLQRLQEHFPALFRCLHQIYGAHYDFFYHLECALAAATGKWIERPAELKALDANLFILGFEPLIFTDDFVVLVPGVRWLPLPGSEIGRSSIEIQSCRSR